MATIDEIVSTFRENRHQIEFLETPKLSDVDLRATFDYLSGKDVDIRVIYDRIKDFQQNLIGIVGEASQFVPIDATLLHAYLTHDAFHLASDLENLMILLSYTSYPRELYQHNKGRTEQFIYGQNNTFETIKRAYISLLKLCEAIVLTDIGYPIEYDEFSLDKLVHDVINLVSNRFNFPLIMKDKEIIFNVDLEVSRVYGNEGMMWSIVYNNVKNAGKKLLEMLSRNEIGEAHVSIRTFEMGQDYFMLAFADNGSPISIDRVKKFVYELCQREVEIFDPEMSKRLKRWVSNPFAVNRIYHEDFTNLVFIANLTGSGLSFTGGLGLYGTRYCITELNGAILYGEDIKNGYPVFAYIMPKRSVRDSKAERISDELKTKKRLDFNPIV